MGFLSRVRAHHIRNSAPESRGVASSDLSPQKTEKGKKKQPSRRRAEHSGSASASERRRAPLVTHAALGCYGPHAASASRADAGARARSARRGGPLPLLHTPQTMRVSAHAALPSRSSQQQQRLSPHGEPRQGRLLTGASAPRPPPGRARRQRRAAREEVGGGAPQTGKGGSQSGGRGVGGG